MSLLCQPPRLSLGNAATGHFFAEVKLRSGSKVAMEKLGNQNATVEHE